MTATQQKHPGEQVARSRGVEQLVLGKATSDGAGVKLTRVLTQPLQRRLDPFLMLDAFRSDQPGDYIGGFPDHPHRGFEAITYMIAGRMRHRDSAGNEGLLESGGLQWMTAARGVIHSEMPEQQDGLMEGFQLWLNLPARDKMNPFWYRDFKADEIPSFTTELGVSVRVIAGASHGVSGAVTRAVTEPLYLDVHLPAGARFAQTVAPQAHAFAYVYRGDATIGGTRIPERNMAILADDGGDGVVFEAGPHPARVLLVAGLPLDEPIVQHGPFVMNTEAEIYAAVSDYKEGRLGRRV